MNVSDPSRIVADFIERINKHDVEGLTGLMSADHLFIDSLGSSLRGREAMRRAWIAYFHMIPDYSIESREVIRNGDTVGVFGIARGTFSSDGTLDPKNQWEMPAAWRAVVKEGQIAEWQVYADNEPVRRIMATYED